MQFFLMFCEKYLPKGPQSHGSWCNLEGFEGISCTLWVVLLPWLEHWKIMKVCIQTCVFNFQIQIWGAKSQLRAFFCLESPKFLTKIHGDSSWGTSSPGGGGGGGEIQGTEGEEHPTEKGGEALNPGDELMFFWLPVGNEGPSTFTAWYYLGMKLNPHSLRVGPASFFLVTTWLDKFEVCEYY